LITFNLVGGRIWKFLKLLLLSLKIPFLLSVSARPLGTFRLFKFIMVRLEISLQDVLAFYSYMYSVLGHIAHTTHPVREVHKLMYLT
jgi:hypothetical protein